ncbi:MAG: response regulator transcription factor [Thermoleophilia bacterium]|nr:response regulator transcription factor [Thermoleophilia bacterium]
MGTGACVLVVDDEPMVREVLSRYLERDGFAVETAADGEAALSAFEARPPDLVLLDLMLPVIDGFEVFRRMRAARPASPVIMLTARGDVTDRIVGLEIGADDYVAKPFSAKEVVARVRTVLRRADGRQDTSDSVLRCGDLVIDARSREVTLGRRDVTLTPREFELLHYLASNPGAVHSRYDLLDALWDVAFDGDPATVTVHVRRLREKIEADPSHPRRLVTVWGAGYRFVQ